MESVAIWQYIYFGTALRYFQDVQEGWPVHGENFILDNLDSFLRRLKEFALPVTERAAVDLRVIREELAETDAQHKLTSDEAKRLAQEVKDVRNTCEAEARGKMAFIVTDKRLDVLKLLADVRGLMAPGVFDSLPDVAQYDLLEAGKCIAFERPTAAAFHLLRATEGVLRHFYCSIVRRGRVDPMLWGAMVQPLRKRKKAPPVELLDNLDNIRRSFRNPTQHPDKIYDVQEVQDLFGLCVDVVNRMVTSPHWRSLS